MEFKTLGRLIDYIKENFYTTDFKESHTRKQLGYMLNMLYPFQKVRFAHSQPFSTMCKRRAVEHIEFYIHLHKIRCKHIKE